MSLSQQTTTGAGAVSRHQMRVIKRDGTYENVSFDKVLNRLTLLSDNLDIGVAEIAQRVLSRIKDGVKTSELDEFASQMCSSLIADHPDYGRLAARIIISNHHKNTSPSFSETVQMLHQNTDIHGKPNPLVSDELYRVVMANKEKLNSYINYERDYRFDYFGFKTLERGYLQRIDGRVVERPQHLFMRVAIGIHGDDLKDALETYDYLSQTYFMHATPTLFNAGTRIPQLSSCFLLAMREDSVAGMYQTLEQCAHISKYAGGIGLHVHNIRARGSAIRGTNGKSNGLIPMLRVYNATARHIDQAGRRNASIAIYLEPWHADVEDFLELKKNHGAEEERARDLFYALWIPDLFMERVRDKGTWSLMCPDECPGLADVYGDDFKTLYEKYESEGRFRRQIPAQDLWLRILESQIETGTPYLLYKDHANRKSNQKNLGTIKSSNLCSEIIEYSDKDEVAVCNLASMCLPTYVNVATKSFDFEKLHQATKVVTKNLNKVIDRNMYPVPEARNSNLRHRPIGIGVQGLADVFALLKIPFESEEAKQLNRDIFETIYHGAVEASMEIAKKREEWFYLLNEDVQKLTGHTVRYLLKMKEHLTAEQDSMLAEFFSRSEHARRLAYKEGELCAIAEQEAFPPGAYSSFVGSPASKGLLQFDLWNVDPTQARYDWSSLKEAVVRYGLRNSLLLAPMPTASTSQIAGFNEAFEPFTSNLYKRKTLAGEFIIVNKYLVQDLIELGLWNKEMKEAIMIGEGSVQHVEEIPAEIRERYKTVWEIKQKTVIDMAADRGAFVCQSQSMNLFVESPDFKRLTTMHFYAWQKGLKTGIYYLRTKPKAMTQQFTIDPRKARGNVRLPATGSGENVVATAGSPIKSQSPVPPISPTTTPSVASVSTPSPLREEVQEEEDELEAVGVCRRAPGCKTCSS